MEREKKIRVDHIPTEDEIKLLKILPNEVRKSVNSTSVNWIYNYSPVKHWHSDDYKELINLALKEADSIMATAKKVRKELGL